MIHQAPRLSKVAYDEVCARLDDARRRGGCDFHEGVPLHLNPYTDAELRRAWIESWKHAWLAKPVG